MANPRLLLGLACLGASLCAGCGSSFTGSDSTGGDAGAGSTPAEGGSGTSAGSDSGGASGETSAGTGGMNGGSTSSAGMGSSGASTGGSNAGTGGTTAMGGTTATGGTTTMGGTTATGGTSGNAGTGGVPDCKTLQAEYTTLLAKARACDQGSTDQCSPSSTLPSSGTCGCPILVNAKSEATNLAQKKYKQLEDNKCLSGAICEIACVSPKAASCQQQTSGMGSAYLCMASAPLTN